MSLWQKTLCYYWKKCYDLSMKNFQLAKDFWKKPGFILFLILFSFFLREFFLSAVFPIFSGQDEARHYNTVQYLNEPKEKTWEIQEAKRLNEKKNLDTYNFSEEIISAGNATEIFAFKSSLDRMNFPLGSVGKNEDLINSRQWQPLNKKYPPDITGRGHQDLYHQLGALIEKTFSEQSILVRFYLIRVFSIFLATIFIFLAYFVFKNVGFSPYQSLLITAIISFQPKFSTYMTNINYAPLMFVAFSAFTLGGVLILKNGLNWKNGILLLLSVVVGILSKGTSVILIPVLLGIFGYQSWLLWKKTKQTQINWKYIFSITLAIIFILSLFSWIYNFKSFLPKTENGTFAELTSSLFEYLSKSLPKIDSSAKNYWGDLNWVRNDYSSIFTNAIWIFEIFSAIGIIWILFAKRKMELLVEKKYIIFFIAMIVALQFGIRFYDWRTFSISGQLNLGTPGRYFLPNLISHMALVFVGLSVFFREKKYLNFTMLFWTILMFAFLFHSIFNIIVFRYYL